MTADTLQNYVRQVRTSTCFDTISEIKKAIREKDEATALVALGELKEQISLLSDYINSLERIAAQPGM